jgi:glycosyltransferase involved in cell wall biosynthesis
MPAASVIIPTYNRANVISFAIDSVLSQSFQNYEIIVIDDGSIDSTFEAVKAYGNKVRYIRQGNMGVSAARNTGIRNAQSQWVAFLDSDDEWLPNYLPRQMEMVKRYPECVCHISNSVTITMEGACDNHFQGTGLASAFHDKASLVLDRPFHTIVKHSPWFVQAAIMRLDVLLRTSQFDTELSIGEDLDLLARMALKGPFSISNSQLVCIHRRAETPEYLTKQVSTDAVIQACETFGRVLRGLKGCNGLTGREIRVLDEALSSNRRGLANVLLRIGRSREAKVLYKEALLTSVSIHSFARYLISLLPSGIATKTIRN